LVAGAGNFQPANSHPTMLDMTFPVFAAKFGKTDIMLLPVG
jgi:hypothetical protein